MLCTQRKIEDHSVKSDKGQEVKSAAPMTWGISYAGKVDLSRLYLLTFGLIYFSRDNGLISFVVRWNRYYDTTKTASLQLHY